ncbi:acyltransferase family protein [Leuconostoc mesenteroides]|uniref:acyltransferase family protein n=1 Tax=Leuconostoc mesenteroides TaxID=1245 RepID=UPI002360FC7F|nr:acyltransferase family protein [Leuconostoc mesenteroides]
MADYQSNLTKKKFEFIRTDFSVFRKQTLTRTVNTAVRGLPYHYLRSSHRSKASSTSTRLPAGKMEIQINSGGEKSKRRFEEFDVAKAIGILLVVIGHNIPTGSLHEFIYSFHMTLFLVVSGLVIKHESLMNLKTIRETVFMNQKALAYFLFYSIIYILFDLVVRVLWLKSESFHLIFWDVYQTLTFFGISVLWFISALFLAKVLASRILASEFRLSINILIIMLTLVGVGAVNYIMPSHIGMSGLKLVGYYPVIAITRTLLMASFLMMGYLLRPIIFRFLIMSKSYVGAVLCSSLLLVNVLFSPYTGTVDYHYLLLGNAPVTLMLGLTGSIGVLGCSSLIVRASLGSKAFVFLGKNSLFVMVTHEYFLLSGTGAVLIHWLHLSLTLTETYFFRISVLLVIEILLIWMFSSKIELLIIKLTNRISTLHTQ